MTSRTKLWALSAGALALSLALAGCGGGGSSSGPSNNISQNTGGGSPPGGTNTDGMMGEEKTDREMLAYAIATLAMAEETLDDLPSDATDEERGAALLAVEQAKTAVAEAEALDDNQADLAEAKKVGAAIGPDGMVLPYPGTGTDDAAPFVATAGEVAKLAGDTDGNEFTKAEMPEHALAMIQDWTGAMYSREVEDDAATLEMDESAMQTVVAYTDRTPNSAVAYSAYYTGNSAPDDHVAWRGITSVDSDGVLTLDEAVNNDSRPLFGGEMFGLTAEDQTKMVTPDDTSTLDVVEGAINGSFHGVPGTYSCTGTCSVSSDSDGNLMTLTGSWTFTPTAMDDALDTVMVAGVKQDLEYLEFGYWIVEDADGDYTVGTYASGNNGTDNDGYGTVAALEGSASYAGPATGLYMRKRVGSDGEPTSAMSGQFTANASLNVNFGGDQIAVARHDKISGTVSNFMNSYGQEIDSTWTVMLNEIDFTATANDGTFTGGTTGSGDNAGIWSGRFEGPAEVDGAVAMPNAVTGVFTGHFDNGHVAGAFGAKKETE